MALRGATRRLVQVFFAWKAVLFLVAVLSPGPGYDTSGLVALNPGRLRHAEVKNWSIIDRLSLNLLRWDALYFTKSAQRGYLYEQEWAFSGAHSFIIGILVKLVSRSEPYSLHSYVWAGVVVSNACHLLSVLALYSLADVLLGHQQDDRIPFVASILHIVSPAGMFLNAPYAESLFSLLNFTGMYLYSQARTSSQLDRGPTIRENCSVLGAGILFMLATWIRSNGLLSGLLFVHDALVCLPNLLNIKRGTHKIRRLAVTCASGTLLGIGAILPQYVAYQTYCASEPKADARPWCHKTVPSIYTWVQSHYWNVGFLRYWTPSNLPLFLMAAPMLWLLIRSGLEHYLHSSHIKPIVDRENPQTSKAAYGNLPQLALPQLVLAVTAATNFHVQVINRLSSGYPVWYLAVARWIMAQSSPTASKDKLIPQASQWICRGLIMYAMIQGALFANFLPPA